MGAGEGEVMEGGDGAPFGGEFGGEGSGFAVYFGVGGLEGDAVVRDGVLDGGEGARLKMGEAARECGAGLRRGAAEDFEVWKFPEAGVYDIGSAFADEDRIAVPEDVGDELSLARFFAFGDLREFGDAIQAEGLAGAADGAGRALRFARGADGGAEFHEALVKRGGRGGGGNELGAEVPKAGLVCG